MIPNEQLAAGCCATTRSSTRRRARRSRLAAAGRRRRRARSTALARGDRPARHGRRATAEGVRLAVGGEPVPAARPRARARPSCACVPARACAPRACCAATGAGDPASRGRSCSRRPTIERARAAMSHAQRIRRRRRGSGGPRNKAFLAFMVLGIVRHRSAASPRSATSSPSPPRRRRSTSLKARDPRRELARLRRRRQALGFIQADELRLPVAGDEIPQVAQGRDGRDRGRALLQAQGRRLRGRRPRGGQEPRLAQDRAGRLDDHDAARPQPLHLQRARPTSARSARPSSPRSSRTSTRKNWILDKYLNTVPYGTVGGQSAIGVAGRGADVLRQAGQGPHAARGGAAGRPAAGAVGLLARALPRRRARRAATRCCARWPSCGMITPEQARQGEASGLGVKHVDVLHAPPRGATSSTTSRTSCSRSTAPQTVRAAA